MRVIEQMLFDRYPALLDVERSLGLSHAEFDIEVGNLLIKDTAGKRWLDLLVPYLC